jgi:hypothetical protein
MMMPDTEEEDAVYKTFAFLADKVCYMDVALYAARTCMLHARPAVIAILPALQH